MQIILSKAEGTGSNNCGVLFAHKNRPWNEFGEIRHCFYNRYLGGKRRLGEQHALGVALSQGEHRGLDEGAGMKVGNARPVRPCSLPNSKYGGLHRDSI